VNPGSKLVRNGDVRISGSRQFKLKQVAPGIYEIDINKGEEVMLLLANDK